MSTNFRVNSDIPESTYKNIQEIIQKFDTENFSYYFKELWQELAPDLIYKWNIPELMECRRNTKNTIKRLKTFPPKYRTFLVFSVLNKVVENVTNRSMNSRN